jgi:tetratricopeptide (TPR) repeat protein
VSKIDFEKERKALDREITFFHFKRARKKISKCLKETKKKKDEFFLNYFLAQDKILKEKFLEAIGYLNKALKVRKNDGCAYNDKALCLADLGKFKEALDCFNQGLRRDPNCVSLYHNKGWLLNLLERYKEAVLCFKKALELDESRVEAIFSLADTYYHLGQRKLAKRYFRRALGEIKGKSSYMYRATLKRLNKI